MLRIVCSLLLLSCGGRVVQRDNTEPAAPEVSAIVCVEHDQSGGQRLVFVDPVGDRVSALSDHWSSELEGFPTWSPDGTWIAYLSNRGVDANNTRIWVTPANKEFSPVVLDSEYPVQRDPTWGPSSRLWYARLNQQRYEIVRRELIVNGDVLSFSPPELMVSFEDGASALHPNVGPDGTLFFSKQSSNEISLWSKKGEESKRLSRSDTVDSWDSGPSVSPDGNWLAFSRALVGAGRVDVDLYLMDLATGKSEPLAQEPLSDQTGAVWTKDGKYVLATSTFRGEKGKSLFASVVVADMNEEPREYRALQGTTLFRARSTPAVNPLATVQFGGLLPYHESMRRVLEQLRAQESAQEK